MNRTFEDFEEEQQHYQEYDRLETMSDVLDQDGLLLEVNPIEAKALGQEQEALIGAQLATIYSAESIKEIHKVFNELQPFQTRILPKLLLIRRDGTELEVCAIARLEIYPADGRIVLRLDKTDQLRHTTELDDLRHQHSILTDFFSTAQNACWCIEYIEPVDLEAPDNEIVRQVFENSSRWAACNPAMEKLYGLPEGLEFNDQSIQLYFPRNTENEKFIKLLIESGFSIVNAQATDLRHDGTPMYVENDVEAFIENGKLYRMWGVVRDINERVERDRNISNQWKVMASVLDALPFPLVLVDSAHLIEAVNQALEDLSFLPATHLLDQNVSILFCFSEEIEKIWQEFERGSKKVRIDAHIRNGEDNSTELQVFANIIEEVEGGIRYLLTFVPL